MQKNYKRAERYMGARDAEEFVEPYVTSLAPQLLSMMETPQYKHNARQRYTYGEKENELLQEKVNQYEKEN